MLQITHYAVPDCGIPSGVVAVHRGAHNPSFPHTGWSKQMRKMFSFMAISADGYHADTDRSPRWQTFGQEFADYSVEQLNEVDTLVLGRQTYTELSAYWTGELGADFDQRIADKMNSLAKLVVSSTLEAVSWGSSRCELTSVEGLAEFKQTPGKAVVVLGSSSLTGTLLRAGLIDELRLMVNPIILGGGLKLFQTAGTVALELARVRPFESGNVLLTYRPQA